MLGLMQTQGLMISGILKHGARHHASAEVVSRLHDGTTHRYTWTEVERRSRRLVRALHRLGVGASDRIGTLAWNGYRHLEVYYAAPGMAAICHTINPRLHPDDITYIINHAADRVLFVDISFAPLITAIADRISDCVRRGDHDRRRHHAGGHPRPRYGAALLRHPHGRRRRRLRLAGIR